MIGKNVPGTLRLDRCKTVADGVTVARTARQERLMEPTLTPIDATLGATITDIDLADLDDVTWKFVEDFCHTFFGNNS